MRSYRRDIIKIIGNQGEGPEEHRQLNEESPTPTHSYEADLRKKFRGGLT